MRDLQDFIRGTYEAQDSAIANAGGKLPLRLLVPKRYTVTFATVAPAGTQTQQLQIGANGDFFVTRMSFSATNAGAAQTLNTLILPQWRIQITDSGSDELFANGAVDLSNFCNWAVGGTDHRDEPYARVITGRSNLSLQVFSYEAANTYSVDFVLTGVLVKSYGGNM